MSDRITLAKVLISISSPKPDGQHEQQVDVTSRDNLVDSKLHVERARKDKHLQDDRQQQYLHECVTASAQMVPENRDSGNLARSSLDVNSWLGMSSKGDPGQMLRRFGERVQLFSGRGIVHTNAGARQRLKNHEMAHVPMKDCRQTQPSQMLQFVAERSARKCR